MIYVWNQRRQLRRHHRHHNHRQQQHQHQQQQPIVSFIKLGFKSNVKRAIPIWAPIIFSIQICHSLSRSLAFFNLFYLKLITRTSTKPSSIADKREQLPTKSYNIHHQWSDSTVNVDIHFWRATWKPNSNNNSNNSNNRMDSKSNRHRQHHNRWPATIHRPIQAKWSLTTAHTTRTCKYNKICIPNEQVWAFSVSLLKNYLITRLYVCVCVRVLVY